MDYFKRVWPILFSNCYTALPYSTSVKSSSGFRPVFLITCLKYPLSIGIAAGVGTWLYNYDAVKEHTYCRFMECCTPRHIPADTNSLRNALERDLYGQHIVINQIIPALRSHFTNGDKSKKPLVISFHGTPGTGKNYVSDFIAKYLYKEGLNSKFVHKFLGRSDFPIESETHWYKTQINEKVKNAVSRCSWSLFIFDEVDKLPPGVFESISSFLDHHSHIHGVNYRNAIFLFLSNTAGIEIAQHLGDLMMKGVRREDTTMQDFEKILEIGAYNLKGGLQKASIIESHLIDHYIPFLPLERRHVEQCVKAEYSRLGFNNVKEDKVKRMVEDFVTYDKGTGLFATTGCKRLSKKIEVDVLG